MSASQPLLASLGPVVLSEEVSVGSTHRVFFGNDFLSPSAPHFASLMLPRADAPARSLFVLDQQMVEAWPDLEDRIESYQQAFAKHFVISRVLTVPGGEPTKNDTKSLDQILQVIEQEGICRQSYVIAMGGGALLDVAGYAASIAHRGVRLIRFPTTTLSQADSGVGVKNGINQFGKKNFLGSFGVPTAVLNDEIYLKTLSDRDWRAGFSEAVKVSLIKDRTFFEEIESLAGEVEGRNLETLRPIIQRSAELHFKHIVEAGDPFELTVARPLDFGHWAAHKIEQMSQFSVLHGEAVAIGVALDTIYSASMGHLSWEDADRVCRCLSKMGFSLSHEVLKDRETLFEGIEEFRQHLGGELAVTLLKAIGEGFTCHEIDLGKMAEALERLGEVREAG